MQCSQQKYKSPIVEKINGNCKKKVVKKKIVERENCTAEIKEKN